MSGATCVCGHSADAHPSSYERVNPTHHALCSSCSCLTYRESGATPRPWRLGKPDPEFDSVAIDDANGGNVGHVSVAAGPRLVLAVNEHEALMEALREALGILEIAELGGPLGAKVALETAAKLGTSNKARERLRQVCEAFARTAESAIRAHEAPKTGMQVPFHGDFAGAKPSTIINLRWWAREFRAALAATKNGGEG